MKEKPMIFTIKGAIVSVFNIGMPELILILVIALVIFGPGKLPEIGSAVGKAVREFRTASTQTIDVEAEEKKKKEPEKIEDKKKPEA